MNDIPEVVVPPARACANRALLVCALLAALSASAGAPAAASKDQWVPWFGELELWTMPGQAFTSVADLGQGQLIGETNCLLFPVPVVSCGGPGAPAAIGGDLSTMGVIASGEAFAGNDLARTSMTATSTGTAIPGLLSVFFNLVATDAQRLRIDVPGDGLPEFLEVEINYSLSSTSTDRSVVASGAPYQVNTSASVAVYETDTFGLPAPGPGGGFSSVFSPFTAAIGGNIDTIGVSDTLLLRPNTDYSVVAGSLKALSLIAQLGVDERDYAGLDLELMAWADPTFDLSAAFKAANPDIAERFTISRTAIVPLPGTLPLALSAFAVLMAAGRASRKRGTGAAAP